MSFQICIKTDKPLQQIAAEIRDLFSLPSFTVNMHAEEPYCQFEMLGMLVLIRQVEESERDPEVKDYPYCFDLQMSFTDHELDTDTIEYNLQPYYTQLLAFRLNVETACFEKKKVGQHWQIRYCYYIKNPKWTGELLYGEPGWEPAIIKSTPHPWRSIHTFI
jgi:hypothetical protein